jgi:TonB family protein
LFTFEESTAVEWKQWEGRIIDGKFRLGQYLGGSAHSGVFVTEYGAAAPRTAVIKLVPADSAKAQTWMLRRELAARLSHPGLRSIFAFGACQQDGTDLAYAVMEQVEEDLSQVLPIRPLAPAEAREVLRTAIETLRYLHGEGFVHGCPTPANILAAGDRIMLSSDGLLRIGESAEDLWAPNVNGPPESRAGITPAGDVWSLGMLVVESLTQRPPVWEPGAAEDPAIPERLAAPFSDIARRSLRFDPRLRCTLDDIALALHPAAAAPVRPAVATPVPTAKPVAPKIAWDRRYLLPVAVVGVLLVLLMFTGTMLTRGKPRIASPAAEPQATAPAPTVAAEKPTPFPAGNAAGRAEAKRDAAPAPATQPALPAPAAIETTAAGPAGDAVARVMPEVPKEILGTIRGLIVVKVRVRVDPSGSVVDATLDSRGGSRYFDRVALDAARRWRFQPADSTGDGGERARLLRFQCQVDGCQALADVAQP